MGTDTNTQKLRKAPIRRNNKTAFLLTPQLIRDFLKKKTAEGRSVRTQETYQRNLDSFYEFLGDEKIVTQDSLILWKDSLIQAGYAEGTINSRISTVNSFYNYLGRRNWQIVDGKAATPLEKQELSRDEYLALLNKAKEKENIQLYLLIKVLACTDLIPNDMPLLTREAVNEGIVTGKERGTDGVLALPEPLRSELLEYARQRGIKKGPLFINGNRNCHNRSTIMKMIQELSLEIGLAPGKANPRNLRRLHLSTQADFQKQADMWAAQQYASLLEKEEAIIGWRVFQSGHD